MCPEKSHAQAAPAALPFFAMERRSSLDLVDELWWELEFFRSPEVSAATQNFFITWKSNSLNEKVNEQHHQWHNQFPEAPLLGNWTLKTLPGCLLENGLIFHNLTPGKPEWTGAVFEAWMKPFIPSGQIFRLQADPWYLEWAYGNGGEWKSFQNFMETRGWMAQKRQEQTALTLLAKLDQGSRPKPSRQPRKL